MSTVESVPSDSRVSAHHPQSAICKHCRKSITLKSCERCRETQGIVNAIFRMEFGDGAFACNTPNVTDGIADLRKIIASNLVGPVGWPKANPQRGASHVAKKDNEES